MKRATLPVLILWFCLVLPPLACAASPDDDMKKHRELYAEHRKQAEHLLAESARIKKGQDDLQVHEENFRRKCRIDPGNLDQPDPGPECRAQAEEIARFREELEDASNRFQTASKTFTEAEAARLSEGKEITLHLQNLRLAAPDKKFGPLCSASCAHLCSNSDAGCASRLAKCRTDCVDARQTELEQQLKIAEEIWQQIQIER